MQFSNFFLKPSVFFFTSSQLSFDLCNQFNLMFYLCLLFSCFNLTFRQLFLHSDKLIISFFEQLFKFFASCFNLH